MAAGDITYSHGCDGGLSAIATGQVLADASDAINVLIGFVPSRIELHYKDTGATTKDAIFLWIKGMTLGYYWGILMSTGAQALVTSGGPVPYGDTSDDVWDGSGGDSNANGQGFTIPAGLMDADSDVINFTAYR